MNQRGRLLKMMDEKTKDNLFERRDCVICPNPFWVATKNRRARKSAAFLRPRNCVCCSTRCSRKKRDLDSVVNNKRQIYIRAMERFRKKNSQIRQINLNKKED